MRKFISGFTKIVKLMNDMINKDWTPEAKRSFKEIKEMISKELVLKSPYYENPFYIYSLALEYMCIDSYLENL